MQNPSTSDDDELHRLLERQRIWDCSLRYTRGIDRMDLDLIRSVFWPDASNSHGPVAGTVDEFIASWLPVQSAREVSWHMLSNQQYDFSDDGTTAHVETYFIVGVRLTDDQQFEVVGGRYADKFEKRAGKWRIATRVTLLDWQAMADASGMNVRKKKRHSGSRDLTDPTYERPLRPRPAIDTPW